METPTISESNYKQKMSSGFFFLSLGLLITLITSVTSFLNLVFETLNKRFPDVLNATYQYGYFTYEYESMRMALSILIIFFPVFFIISYFWKKFTEKERLGSVDIVIKKWVTYIILFLSSVVVMIDLVALIRYFVSGEITTRFIFKVLTVLGVAVLVGLYYTLSLRVKTSSFKIGLLFSSIASLLFILVIICSFRVMGSPFKQRSLRLDNIRIGDLQNIQYQVINYWQQKEKLPEKLTDLTNPISGYSLPVDPEFEKGYMYEYLKKDKLTFELCATFTLPIPKGWRESEQVGIMPVRDFAGIREVAMDSYPYVGGINESWDHEAGKTCFERTIDKDIYPPFRKSTNK